MTENMHIDHELLVSYLYDECEPAARAGVVAHLERCSRCAEDVATLGATREHLAGWAPPDVALGFQISRPQPAVILRPERWWNRPMPAWAQAVAALLIFGAGLSIGAVRGVSRPDESAVQVTRPAGSPANSPANTMRQALVPAPTPAPVTDLARDVRQLRAELASLRNAPNASVPAGPRADGALLGEIRALITESEERQRSEFTLRAAQLARDVEVQRRVDFSQINETIGRVQGQTGLAVRQQGQALDSLARVVATSTGK